MGDLMYDIKSPSGTEVNGTIKIVSLVREEGTYQLK